MIKKLISYLSDPDNLVPLVCLAVLAIKFFSTIGRFLDTDEEYYFYATSAISHGAGFYADLHAYLPPVLWYFCAPAFRLAPDLYHAMLAVRTFIVLLSLAGFYLIFDLFKKFKLAWFALPATIFILTSMQFDLKLIEYRSDNLLFLLLVLQSWLIAPPEKFSRARTVAFFLLGILSFHVNQKAVYFEPLLFSALFYYYPEEIKNFFSEHKKTIGFVLLAAVVVILFSPAYHRFLYQSYLYPLKILRTSAPADRIAFLKTFAGYNPAFWLTGLAAAACFLFGVRKDRKYLLPLMLLAGSAALVATAYFPYLHYQLYLAWAVLFSLPYLAGFLVETFPGREAYVFLAIFILSLTGFATFRHLNFPLVPLKEYAEEIGRVKQAIGAEKLASFGGSSLSIPTALPFCDLALQFSADERYCRHVAEILKNEKIKYVFIDQRERIKEMLAPEDRYYIYTHYQKYPGLPLMAAAGTARPGLKNYRRVRLNKNFSGRFELVSAEKYEIADRTYFRFSWKVLADNPYDLMAFHHFIGAGGKYLAGADVDPTGGWIDVKTLKKGDPVVYEFSMDKGLRYRSLEVGWFLRTNPGLRVPFENSSFFSLDF